MAYLPLILLLLVAFFSAVTTVALIISLRAHREYRNTIFPVVREVEAFRVRQARVVALISLVLAVAAFGGWFTSQQRSNSFLSNTLLVRPVLPTDSFGNTTQAVITATLSLDASPTPSSDLIVQATVTSDIFSPVPSESPTVTETATPTPMLVTVVPDVTMTPNSTPIPTSTSIPPSATATAAEVISPTQAISPTPTPELPDVDVPVGASLGPLDFAEAISDDRRPIDPAQSFPADTERIYVVFPYEGMRNGLPLTIIWYYQGQEFLRDAYEWSWGSSDRSFAFISPVGSGDYQVELKIGQQTLAQGSFVVQAE